MKHKIILLFFVFFISNTIFSQQNRIGIGLGSDFMNLSLTSEDIILRSRNARFIFWLNDKINLKLVYGNNDLIFNLTTYKANNEAGIGAGVLLYENKLKNNSIELNILCANTLERFTPINKFYYSFGLNFYMYRAFYLGTGLKYFQHNNTNYNNGLNWFWTIGYQIYFF